MSISVLIIIIGSLGILKSFYYCIMLRPRTILYSVRKTAAGHEYVNRQLFKHILVL